MTRPECRPAAAMPSPVPRLPDAETVKGAAAGAGPRSLGRTPDFRGLRTLLDDGLLTDIKLVLRGSGGDGAPAEGRGAEEKIPAHKAVLAGVSDVLRAQFAGSFGDASTSVWSPEVGSALAWRWTLRWIYGHEDTLPASLLVEVLLLADHFQIESLSAGILAWPMEDIAEEVVFHILSAWACPEVLGGLARRCVPLVVHSVELWLAMWDSAPQNVALFARFVPVLCEMDRLRLLCGYVERRGSQAKESPNAVVFPNCLLSAVGWEAFPVDILEAASRDDLVLLAELAGLQLRSSQALRDTMFRAIARRCQALELQLQGVRRPSQHFSRKERVDMYLLPLGGDSLRAPLQLPHGSAPSSTIAGAAGLFARLVGLGLSITVQLSSVHSRTPRDKARLFDVADRAFTAAAGAAAAAWHLTVAGAVAATSSASGAGHGSAAGGVGISNASTSAHMVAGMQPPPLPPPITFGTEDQSAEDAPWIEVFSKDCEIRPVAIGLRHGWYDSHYCRSFVLEACHSAPLQLGLSAALIGPTAATAVVSLSACGAEGDAGLGLGAPDTALAAAAHGGGSTSWEEVRWTTLLSRTDHALSSAGEVFSVDAGVDGAYFDRFRVRMTGWNSVGSWHLMVNWFDVYGHFRAKASYFTGDGCRVEATL